MKEERRLWTVHCCTTLNRILDPSLRRRRTRQKRLQVNRRAKEMIKEQMILWGFEWLQRKGEMAQSSSSKEEGRG